MNSEYLFDKDGSDAEIEQLEGLLSEFRIKPVPPSLSRVKGERRSSLFGRYRLGFALSFASLLVLFLASGILVFKSINRPGTERVELDNQAIVQDFRKDSPVIDPPLVDSTPPAQIEQREVKMMSTRRRIQRPRSLVAKSAKRVPHLTPEELYAYQKLKVALFIAGSQIKIIQDTVDQVNNDQKGKLNR
jgi:hypothetical protein